MALSPARRAARERAPSICGSSSEMRMVGIASIFRTGGETSKVVYCKISETSLTRGFPSSPLQFSKGQGPDEGLRRLARAACGWKKAVMSEGERSGPTRVIEIDETA